MAKAKKDEEQTEKLKEKAVQEENGGATEDLANKEADAQNQMTELNERLLRQMAEFDNYKKRTQKEKEEMGAYARASCVKDFLGVLDNFERALEAQCKDEDYKKGMEMIFAQFEQTLQKLDVTEIAALNEVFNPDYHNAINQIEDESFGENTVCQVLQKGYKMGERVIRHAMVIVANP